MSTSSKLLHSLQTHHLAHLNWQLRKIFLYKLNKWHNPHNHLPQRAQPLHRTTERWLNRDPHEAEVRQRMELENQEHEQSFHQWEAQMEAQQAQAPNLQANANPTTVYSELQPHPAPTVHQALRENDPGRPQSATTVPLKKPPPATGRPIVK